MKYVLLSFILMIISYSCKDSASDLEQGYFLTYNSVNDLAIGKKINGISIDESFSYVIYGQIVEYSFDATFIIVAEKPRDSVPESLRLNYDESQKIFKQSNFRQYYIINKRKDSLYGPYKRTKFLAKKTELRVSDKLSIK